MVYELGPLRSYVRFYLTVTTQLHAAWHAIERIHENMREAFAPFAEVLAPVQLGALSATQKPGVQRPTGLAGLWQPQDPEGLTGLTDVYEVAGRFTFQGQDGENLERVQAVVSAARSELQQLRSRIGDLAKLPELTRHHAARLSAEEAKTAALRRSERLAAFTPLAQTLVARAKQTLDAVHAVGWPGLEDLETAAAEYAAYVVKVDQVYQTCLPYLRKALADMYLFVGCEVPTSWPDSLPLLKELPAELVDVPPTDSPDLQRARANADVLQEEEAQLLRAKDDIAVTQARMEGELAAATSKEAEVRKEIETAGVVVSYVTTLDQIDQLSQALGSLEQQKAQRTFGLGEATTRQQQTQTAISALEQELADRSRQIEADSQRLGVERDNEPAIFGKDDWRKRVAGLEQAIEATRSAFTQRQGILNQLKIDLSAFSVQVQTEQAHLALLDRWLVDTKAKQESLREAVRAMDERLAAARPPRTPSILEAEQAVAALQTLRSDVLERIERLKTDIRRQKEEAARVIARLRQIEQERQRVDQMAQSAWVAATQGREAALRQLAARRKAGVQQHIGEVLGALERSLSSVDTVFVEAAKAVIVNDHLPQPLQSEVLREQAERVAPVVEQVISEIEPELLSQDAMLGQIQREFCDVAGEACRNAWG